MPVCALSSGNGLALQQMASLADACSGVVLLQPADVPPNPFVLSEAEGALTAAAVGAVWAAAWCWKALARTLNTDGATEESSS